MTDNLTPEKRSKVMRSVKSRDTKPEMTVRRMLHAAGYRFRLHSTKLAGKPDIIFPSRKKVVFVHGCFWHVHPGCCFSHIPASPFWEEKLRKNTDRDKRVLNTLRETGWQVFTVWECDLKGDLEPLYKRLKDFLGKGPRQASGEALQADPDTS